MASKKQPVAETFRLTVTEEKGLVRFGLSGRATMAEVEQIRRANARYAHSQLPVLVVDDGLTFVDTVCYGALAQWAQAVRNRRVGWVMATSQPAAGRMFHMAGVIPQETLYASEESARKALDRGEAGQRVASVGGGRLALDGLRMK